MSSQWLADWGRRFRQPRQRAHPGQLGSVRNVPLWRAIRFHRGYLGKHYPRVPGGWSKRCWFGPVRRRRPRWHSGQWAPFSLMDLWALNGILREDILRDFMVNEEDGGMVERWVSDILESLCKHARGSISSVWCPPPSSFPFQIPSHKEHSLRCNITQAIYMQVPDCPFSPFLVIGC